MTHELVAMSVHLCGLFPISESNIILCKLLTLALTLTFSISHKYDKQRAASAKAKQDSTAYMCKICRQTFMVNAKSSLLYLHVTSKHDDKKDTPTECFDSLAGFDPADPDGKKKAATKSAGPVKPKKKKGGGGDDLASLLDAGLKVSKGKKK